jgi:hypothetical protein
VGRSKSAGDAGDEPSTNQVLARKELAINWNARAHVNKWLQKTGKPELQPSSLRTVPSVRAPQNEAQERAVRQEQIQIQWALMLAEAQERLEVQRRAEVIKCNLCSPCSCMCSCIWFYWVVVLAPLCVGCSQHHERVHYQLLRGSCVRLRYDGSKLCCGRRYSGGA